MEYLKKEAIVYNSTDKFGILLWWASTRQVEDQWVTNMRSRVFIEGPNLLIFKIDIDQTTIQHEDERD
mgnify:CR=1 FL=1